MTRLPMTSERIRALEARAEQTLLLVKAVMRLRREQRSPPVAHEPRFYLGSSYEVDCVAGDGETPW